MRAGRGGGGRGAWRVAAERERATAVAPLPRELVCTRVCAESHVDTAATAADTTHNSPLDLNRACVCVYLPYRADRTEGVVMQRLVAGFATAQVAALPTGAVVTRTTASSSSSGSSSRGSGRVTSRAALVAAAATLSPVVSAVSSAPLRCYRQAVASLAARNDFANAAVAVTDRTSAAAAAAPAFHPAAQHRAHLASRRAHPHRLAPSLVNLRAMASSAAPGDDDAPLQPQQHTQHSAGADADDASASASPTTVVGTLESKLRDALSPSSLQVVPAFGDPNGAHVSIKVVSEAFEGKRTVARHQLVYKAIWEEMQSAVHAVDSMVTQTPAEAEAAGSSQG